jgi:hypothetical protein
MKIFDSERKMQEWLSKELGRADGLADLIDGLETLHVPEGCSWAEKAIWESYRIGTDSLNLTEILSEDENISITRRESLRPDFVLYSAETESIVLVELKNLAGATREAGTELGAYAGEVRTAIPFLSDADLIHVVVSTEWPTLLRHYVSNEIIWNGRVVVCLQPTRNAEGEVSLRLVMPSEIVEDFGLLRISERHLGGFQVCLYDQGLQVGTNDRSRLDGHLQQMRSGLQAMAAAGNARNGHGFAFLWRDSWKGSLAPYSITVVNFCAYQTIERFLHLDIGRSVPLLVSKLLTVVQESQPQGHGNALSEITDSGTKLLEHFCSPRAEGFCSWRPLRDIMAGRAEFRSFSSWGLFASRFTEMLSTKYASGDLSTQFDCPFLGIEVVDSLVDETYPFIDVDHLDLDEFLGPLRDH